MAASVLIWAVSLLLMFAAICCGALSEEHGESGGRWAILGIVLGALALMLVRIA